MSTPFRSMRSQPPETRKTLKADLRAFVGQFKTRATFEAYCDTAQLTASERIYLETLIPAHLTVDADAERAREEDRVLVHGHRLEES